MKMRAEQKTAVKNSIGRLVFVALSVLLQGYMDLRTGDEIKPIFDMDFGCDQRAYAGCRDPALWPQDKCSV